MGGRLGVREERKGGEEGEEGEVFVFVECLQEGQSATQKL